MQDLEKLQVGNHYHVYTRGINRQDIFLAPSDYAKFIVDFEKHCANVLDVLAYCLMGNHLHSLIYVKEEIVVPEENENGAIHITASKQFGHLLNGYAQKFNKAYNRTGGLFEKPFKRKLVESRQSLVSTILYIHTNPTHHLICDDFRQWPYTSYHDLMESRATFLNRKAVLELFGGREKYIDRHLEHKALKDEQEWLLE
jgi:putative transposase